ncbi:hypothetical protein AAFF_G00301650 [Aldrovandia affinis]|uniref:Uncharacterized protein n=1 Tax=Aldrovandia affinis TaxID=143900 RepID=A0AAD7SQ48_9TELE|nr:hypothetical protein AAFF_G00301650 [Aldrovandia affinis]
MARGSLLSEVLTVTMCSEHASLFNVGQCSVGQSSLLIWSWNGPEPELCSRHAQESQPRCTQALRVCVLDSVVLRFAVISSDVCNREEEQSPAAESHIAVPTRSPKMWPLPYFLLLPRGGRRHRWGHTRAEKLSPKMNAGVRRTGGNGPDRRPPWTAIIKKHWQRGDEGMMDHKWPGHH